MHPDMPRDRRRARLKVIHAIRMWMIDARDGRLSFDLETISGLVLLSGYDCCLSGLDALEILSKITCSSPCLLIGTGRIRSKKQSGPRNVQKRMKTA